ncbi:MAG: acetyltransferase [Firmicutes bacterium]|nr:acetyltransferase [Bacillota bacterium]
MAKVNAGKPLVIVGAGGHGREVARMVEDINRCSGEQWELLGFVDDSVQGETVEGDRILGDVGSLVPMDTKPWVVCAIGNPRTRKRIATMLEQAGLRFATLVHPSVVTSRFVTIGEGSMVSAGTILTTNIAIGRHCLINTGCRIGHDTRLGDYASLMIGVSIAGEVTVGSGCFLGLNACVINRVSVGEWSIIGAGAAVVKDIPPRVVAVGVPATPIKTLDQ